MTAKFARALLVLLSSLAATQAHADDRMDKKLFLLNRALKNKDCDQALSVARGLVEDYPQTASPQLALAKSLLCRGDVEESFDAMELFTSYGGSPKEGAPVRADIAKVAATVTLSIEAAVWLPPVEREGFVVTVDGRKRAHLGPIGAYRFALRPGSHSISVSHPRFGGASSLWDKTIVAVAGKTVNEVVSVRPDVAIVVVRVYPESAAASVDVTALEDGAPVRLLPCAEFWSADRPADCEQREDRFALVRPGATFVATAIPKVPTVNRASGAVVASSASQVATLALASREPARLTVGAFKTPVRYVLELPTGALPVIDVSDIDAGAGEVGWTMTPVGTSAIPPERWVLQTPSRIGTTSPTPASSATTSGKPSAASSSLSGTFDVPAGRSALPLPRSVHLLVGAEEFGLLAPPANSAGDVEFVVPLVGRRGSDERPYSVTIRVPGLAPGEHRTLVLPVTEVPAMQAALGATRVERSVEQQRRAAVGFVGGAVLGGVTAGVFARRASVAKAASETARSPEDYEGYKRSLAQNRSGVGASLAAAGVSAGLSVVFIVRASSADARVDRAWAAVDEAGAVPFDIR